jgi:hypothetical protein
VTRESTVAAPAERGPRSRLDGLYAVLLVLLTVSWMLSVEGRQGIGRDEAQYFRSAERYWGWFETLAANIQAGRPGQSFSRAGIEAYWGDNPEHPVIMKTLYGFSWRLFHRCECVKEAAWHYIPVPLKHRTIPVFARESTAFRFPAIFMAGLGAALVFLLARRWVGRGPALAAAVLSVAQPHYFFHAQIAAFDAPITVMAVAVGLCYWKSLRSPSWAVIGGVVFGVALGVKHNAWLMPIFLAGHAVWMRRHDLLGGRGRRRRIPPIPLIFLAMAVLGPLVFFLHWPRVWISPIPHTRWYVQRHMQHEHYNFEFLGRNWNNPPTQWDRKLLRMTFPFVSTGLTVPATTLALAVAGGVLLARRARRRSRRDPTGLTGSGESRLHDDQTLLPDPPPPAGARGTWLRPAADVDRAPGAFLLVQILGPLAVVAVPSIPIFGGVKHFMPAMPYLAILAAVGLRWLTRVVLETGSAFLEQERVRRALPAAVAALVCLPALLETRRSHPDGLAHYNFFAGGFTGGASLGMNRQFWGYSVLPMLDWMVRNMPPSRAFYWHDVFGDALSFYVRDNRLPPAVWNVLVGEAAVEQSDLGIIIHERHFVLYEGVFWESYGTTQPAYVRTREGVPLVTAYRRRHPR